MADVDDWDEMSPEEFDRRLAKGQSVELDVRFEHPLYSTSVTHGGFAATSPQRAASWDRVPEQLLMPTP